MKTAFNPFSKFNEKHLFIAGILFFILGSYIAHTKDVTYDGFFDAHIYEVSFTTSLLENFINVACFTLLFLAIGKLINAKTRFIDILNVGLISRIPIYIIATFFVNDSKLNTISNDLIEKVDAANNNIDISAADTGYIMVISILLILLLIYSFILMVFGFKTAVNGKKWQHWMLFAAAIVILEITSKYIINNCI